MLGERCEMCAEPITDEHQHVVNLESRALMCTCRGCYLLFTSEQAQLRYRSVPDRYLRFPEVGLGAAEWDALQIPVGLVFLFHNSVQDRLVAFYPGPAGATESELSLEAWQRVVADHPQLGLLRPDVEALLLRGADRDHEALQLPPGADRHLLRAGRHPAPAVARVRRRPGGPRRDRGVLRDRARAAAARHRPCRWPRWTRHERAAASRWSTSSPSRTPRHRS